MSRFLRCILYSIFSLFVCYIAAEGWWRVWMYEGWMGPPRFLHGFVRVDGEASYDLVALEMFLSLYLVGVLVGFVVYLAKRRKIAGMRTLSVEEEDRA